MKISVVIPTYNRRDALGKSLAKLFKQDYPVADYEVIVVVDGSRDGTVEMLQTLTPACRLRILQQENRGQAAARNIGWRAASNDLVLFLDDDMSFDANLLREHAMAHGVRTDGVVFGLVQVAPQSRDSLATDLIRGDSEAYIQRVFGTQGAQWPDEDMCFANTSLFRSMLDAVDGFDESFGYAKEDHELGLRLWKSGAQFRFAPRAATSHVYDKSIGELVLTDAERLGRAYVRLSRKHPEYRSQLPNGWTGSESRPKSFVRELLARMPVSLAPLLVAVLRISNRLRANRAARRVGLALLRAAMSIVVMRSAVRETGGWKAFERQFRVRLPVLLYHHVGPQRAGTLAWLTVSPGRFERHIRFLAQLGYVGIRASDWLRWRETGDGLPAKPILISFDDAYEDVATYALPILAKYGFAATVFVVTQRVGETNEWDERIGIGTHRLMTNEQIRAWSDRGIEFGAHSRTHADLTTLSDSDLQAEISGSASDLASILNVAVTAFAYPYGSHNEEVRACVKQTFAQAFTTQPRLNALNTDPVYLRRTMVSSGDGWLDILFRALFGRGFFDRWRSNAVPVRSVSRSMPDVHHSI